jgi:hypothetical protein
MGFDSDSNLIVVSSGNDRILRYSPAGAFMGPLVPQVPESPIDLDLGAAGRLSARSV